MVLSTLNARLLNYRPVLSPLGGLTKFMANALVVKNPETLLAGPLGSLDAYIERVSQIPVLSRESEL